MIGYKVVRKSKDRFYSCIVWSKAEVQYKEGRFVSAPKWLKREGRDFLFCFGDLDSAIRWYNEEGFGNTMRYDGIIAEIWKIEGKGLQAINDLLDIVSLSLGLIVRWYGRYIPDGTIGFKKVKLLEKMEV